MGVGVEAWRRAGVEVGVAVERLEDRTVLSGLAGTFSVGATSPIYGNARTTQSASKRIASETHLCSTTGSTGRIGTKALVELLGR